MDLREAVVEVVLVELQEAETLEELLLVLEAVAVVLRRRGVVLPSTLPTRPTKTSKASEHRATPERQQR